LEANLGLVGAKGDKAGMRTPLRIFLLLTIVFLPSKSAAETSPLAQVAIEFWNTALSILKGGSPLIAKLEDTQAKSVVGHVYTQAQDLIRDKTVMRESVANGDQVDFSSANLYGRVIQLGIQIDRFGEEIDKVSGLKSGPLRTAVSTLTHDKVKELREAEQAMQKGDKTLALQKLDTAIKSVTKIRDAADCLSRTLEQRKVVCNPETMKPIDSTK
jgi:hypothetical protein